MDLIRYYGRTAAQEMTLFQRVYAKKPSNEAINRKWRNKSC